MTKPSWTAWHQVVHLRDDLRTGELALNEFAAALYDVALQAGKRRIYEDPKQFFALTYPTSALLDLARDVVRRLAGKNQKAVRQLELTYGGGKTHTLITLFHLVNDPASLPQLPAVDEFKARAGQDHVTKSASRMVRPLLVPGRSRRRRHQNHERHEATADRLAVGFALQPETNACRRRHARRRPDSRRAPP